MQNNCNNLLRSTYPLRVHIREALSNTMSDDFKLTQATISLNNPVEDYEQLIKEKVAPDEYVSDAILKANYKKISETARNTIWSLLFAQTPATSEQLKNAAALLQAHKRDACFYAPWDYNDWIVGVRDELLKREMLDFWRDVIVKEELGPCWARDSDYFDDRDDKSVPEFYAHAGCVAPFLAAAQVSQTSQAEAAPVSTAIGKGDTVDTEQFKLAAAKISLEQPVKDYKQLTNDWVSFNVIVPNDIIKRNYRKITAAARNTIWVLLFAQTPPKAEQLKNAAELLQLYKSDACFHAPGEYNDWIGSVRDELLKREMLDFWRDVIVKKELGPCWARDSDYFDEHDDPEPATFYNYAGCKAAFAKS